MWNPKKRRHEFWIKAKGGAWVLVGGNPIDVAYDNFVSPALTSFPALYGIRSQLQWWATGRPRPSGANFEQVNTLGGGLRIKTRPINGSWIAIHYGDIYPFDMSMSPHLYLRSAAEYLTDIHLMAGMVGASNKPSTGSTHTDPDDGIFIRLDTAVDGNIYSVTRAGGIETAKLLGPANLEGRNYCIRVNDDGDQVEFLIDGVVIQTHTTDDNLPIGVPLQPYYEVMTRTNAVRSATIHHYIQVFDSLWV
ncbi:MAG: hypothetical protein JRC66_08440 [Deltaproteobacteria bacterium]|nr:hypothetical protein [Deltaproteobacteria bacterium]